MRVTTSCEVINLAQAVGLEPTSTPITVLGGRNSGRYACIKLVRSKRLELSCNQLPFQSVISTRGYDRETLLSTTDSSSVIIIQLL